MVIPHQQEVRDKYEKILEEAFSAAKMETRVFNKHWIDSPWSGFFEGKDPLRASPTGIHEDTITHICRRFASAPPNASDFNIHRGIQRILNSKWEHLGKMLMFLLMFPCTLLSLFLWIKIFMLGTRGRKVPAQFFQSYYDIFAKAVPTKGHDLNFGTVVGSN